MTIMNVCHVQLENISKKGAHMRVKTVNRVQVGSIETALQHGLVHSAWTVQLESIKPPQMASRARHATHVQLASNHHHGVQLQATRLCHV